MFPGATSAVALAMYGPRATDGPSSAWRSKRALVEAEAAVA